MGTERELSTPVNSGTNDKRLEATNEIRKTAAAAAAVRGYLSTSSRNSFQRLFKTQNSLFLS